jgi:hypothetical protein
MGIAPSLSNNPTAQPALRNRRGAERTRHEYVLPGVNRANSPEPRDRKGALSGFKERFTHFSFETLAKKL